MEQRFVVLAEGAKPKIYKLPVTQTTRLINIVLCVLRSTTSAARSGILIIEFQRM